MNYFQLRPSALVKIEFILSTLLFVFGLFYLITTAVKTDGTYALHYDRYKIEQTRLQLSYNQYYFIPRLVQYFALYASFLILNFKLVPKLFSQTQIPKNALLIAFLLLSLFLTFGTLDTYLKNYLFLRHSTDGEAYRVIFTSSFFHTSWLSFLFGFYTAIKYASIYLYNHIDEIESKYKIVTRNGITAFIIWLVSILLLLITNAETGPFSIWLVTIPFAICLYWYSCYSLIPASMKDKKPLFSYYIKVLVLVLISAIPLFLVVKGISDRSSIVFMVLLFHIPFQLIVTTPLSWYLYSQQQKKQQEIANLKSALGQSNANYDFLRSQINPHFLFNALNTIYGTALQEKAERTSLGVERLGDMMRFMLQENMQEKIPLSREIEYLNNYIELQKLRTDTSPQILIKSQIDDWPQPAEIAPMLLIPFVENAFKHGISLREPSHIVIVLQFKGDTLYFDVTNSIHHRTDSDPERYSNGVGLSNVRQRLQLLYEGRHELLIRESATEFFVHLTIHLNQA
jgi:sensor histidine kinase YesM